MKKFMLLCAIVFTSFSMAQSNVVPLDKMSQKDLAIRKVKDLDKILDLNEEQEKKLIALYSEKNMIARKPRSVQEAKSKRITVTAKLKAILTPQQYEKLIKSSGVEEKKAEIPKERY